VDSSFAKILEKAAEKRETKKYAEQGEEEWFYSGPDKILHGGHGLQPI
jgi:hypothetical protein